MRKHLVIMFGVLCFVGTLFSGDIRVSREQQIRTLLQQERRHIFSRLTLAAGDDEEALMLIEYHRNILFNTRLFLPYALPEQGRMLHAGIDNVPMGSVMVFPSTHEQRARAGSPSVSNFRFGRGDRQSTVDVPLLERFTPLWFGVRMLHELRHSYDALSGLEPKITIELGNVSRAFAEGEVRAHSFEHRLLDLATDGRFLRTVHEVSAQDQTLPGFPDEQPAHYPRGDSIFEPLDELFRDAESPDETNTRWGSYNIAYYFAMCDRNPSISDCRLRFMRSHMNGHPLR